MILILIEAFSLKRIYFDTNFFIYAFYSKRDPYKSMQARAILSKISAGIYQGVTSKLALLEVISALRKMMVDNPKSTPPTVDEIHETIDAVFLSILLIKNLEIFESKSPFTAHEDEALLLMQKYQGRITKNKDKKKNKKEYNYKFLHPVDALHVVLAKEASCDALCTADRAFNQVKSKIRINLLR